MTKSTTKHATVLGIATVAKKIKNKFSGKITSLERCSRSIFLRNTFILLCISFLTYQTSFAQCTSCPSSSSCTITTCGQSMTAAQDKASPENKVFATPYPICCEGPPATCPKEKYTYCYYGLIPLCSYEICFVRLDDIIFDSFNAVVCTGGVYGPRNTYLSTRLTKICKTKTTDSSGNLCDTTCLPLYGTWSCSAFSAGAYVQPYEYYLGGYRYNDDTSSVYTCTKPGTAVYDPDFGTLLIPGSTLKLSGKVFHNSNPYFYNPPPGQHCPINTNPCLCP